MTHDFDLIVLGAGSGGVAASRRAALHGARVAVVEGGRVGGTCVIRGCVPKKLMMYAAQYGDAMREAAGYGWALGAAPRFEMPRWAAAKAAETARLEGVYRRLLADGGVELIEGWGRIAGPNRVAIGDRTLSARDILIATGAAPVRDTLPGIALAATSDELLDLQDLPARAAVIGSGYIALEFASILSRLGVAVSQYYRAPLPLRGFDDDLRRRAALALQTGGVELHPLAAPRALRRAGSRLALDLGDGSAPEFDFVLNATGRRPNTQGLGLETIGLAPHADGSLPVDAHGATPVAGVHAIGDVTNRKNLTPVAIAEGRALADRLFAGGTQAIALDLVASAVFTLPPIASIGPSEAQAGSAITVYEADFKPMRHAFTGSAERSYMKLIVDTATERVLALHMIGADAPEIVQSLAVALTCGATKPQFDRTLAVHPTAAEEWVLMRTPRRR